MNDLYTPVVDSLTTDRVTGTHVKKRIGEVSAVDTYAAKRIADDLEALIIDVGTRALEGIEDWPRSRGFEVLTEPIVSGATGRTRLYLQLVEGRYRQVFRALCGDVCKVMAGTSDESGAVRTFHRRLVRWQSFLQKHGPEGLSENERCGLFGELLVFRDLLLPRIAAGLVVRAWRGCKRAHQDFQFPDRALEVKTTRATIPDRISVSNVQQLDGEGMEHMFLTLVHVNQNETTGETLNQIVDSVRAALPDDARDLLEEGLEEVGYSDAHRDIYSTTRYQHLDLQHFEVRDDFPRLIRGQVPDGVKNVRYELSIDACRPFLTAEAEVLGTLVEGLDDDSDN